MSAGMGIRRMSTGNRWGMHWRSVHDGSSRSGRDRNMLSGSSQRKEGQEEGQRNNKENLAHKALPGVKYHSFNSLDAKEYVRVSRGRPAAEGFCTKPVRKKSAIFWRSISISKSCPRREEQFPSCGERAGA